MRRQAADAIQPTLALTPEQCEFFWQEGYLSIPAITTQADIDRIRGIYDRLFEEKAGWNDGNYFDLAGSSDEASEFRVPQIQRMSDYAPELFDTLYFANAEAAARQLLGHRARHVYDHGIRKPPHNRAATPWHQDIAFVDGVNYFESLTVWMPLQAVDDANGCMSFLPRSHLGPIVPHRSPGGDDRINGLEATGFDRKGAVVCPLPAGGATFHHCRTLHYTGPNDSPAPRRVLAWGFGIRRAHPVVTGTFPWIAAKHNDRLDRLRSATLVERLKRLARPYVNRLLAAGD